MCIPLWCTLWNNPKDCINTLRQFWKFTLWLLRNINIQICFVTVMSSYKAQYLKLLSQLFIPKIPCVGLVYTSCIVSSCQYVFFRRCVLPIKVFCIAVACQPVDIKFDGLHWTILYYQILPTVNFAQDSQHFQDIQCLTPPKRKCFKLKIYCVWFGDRTTCLKVQSLS